MATDIRLLQHDRQVEEPFEDKQIGSSAMPYKRNPMRCERICSLARYVIADAQNAPMTAMTQWLERTLDDSANRRISLPEAFLATDGVLRLVQNVTKGLHVNEKIVEKLVRDYLPFIATENLMMAAVKRGGDRQQLHEIIREASMQETAKMKNGESWDLVAQLAARPEFGMTAEEIRAELEPSRYIGRCPGAGRGYDGRLPRADRSRRTAGGGIDTVTNKTVPARDALRRLPRAFSLLLCPDTALPHPELPLAAFHAHAVPPEWFPARPEPRRSPRRDGHRALHNRS